MFFHATLTRTNQMVQPAATAFAEFTADHPHLHLDSVQMSAGTVTVHLHGTRALEYLAHWEYALGNCARSSDSFPSSRPPRLHYTERRTAVVAGISLEAVAFHDGPGTYDPHGMIWPASHALVGPRAVSVRVLGPQPTPTRRCALALSITAALAVTAVTAVAISRRVNRPGPLRARR